MSKENQNLEDVLYGMKNDIHNYFFQGINSVVNIVFALAGFALNVFALSLDCLAGQNKEVVHLFFILTVSNLVHKLYMFYRVIAKENGY